jgi:hypothetical protein
MIIICWSLLNKVCFLTILVWLSLFFPSVSIWVFSLINIFHPSLKFYLLFSYFSSACMSAILALCSTWIIVFCRLSSTSCLHALSFFFYFKFFIFSFFPPIFISYSLHLHFKCYPERPYTLPPPLPYPPTPTSWPRCFPCTGAYKVCKTKGPLFPMMAD